MHSYFFTTEGLYLILLQLKLASIAIISNFLSAFAGGGAGLLQLPALILLGLPFPTALATHKLASVALGVGAGLRHYREKPLNQYLIAIILCFGLPGVWIGANIVLSIPNQIATIALGSLTLFLGIYSAKKSSLGTASKRIPLNSKNTLLGGFPIFFIGILNGSLTSGTGLFVTIWLVSFFKLSYTRAIGYTLILVGLFWNGTGALVLGLNGEIKWDWIPILISGSLIGGYLGAHLSIKKGSYIVKRTFEILTLIMGSSLIFKSLY